VRDKAEIDLRDPSVIYKKGVGMRLYEWEIRLFARKEKTQEIMNSNEQFVLTEMNMKFGVLIKGKDFMKLKEELEQVVEKYRLKK